MRVEPAESTAVQESRENAPIGQRIRGFQHFGMTVQNMKTCASSSSTTWFWSYCTTARAGSLKATGCEAPAHDLRCPAYPRSLHLCFHLRDDIDFNKFIHDLETESARHGMTNFRANRIIAIPTEEARRNAPIHAFSNKISEGRSNGWALIYARGPEGEALEFVQAFDPVKQVLDSSLQTRQVLMKG